MDSMAVRGLSAAAGRSADTVAAIVFVCSANQCRSPIAEQIARRVAADLGREVNICSMGLLPGGRPSPRLGVSVAAEAGLVLGDHCSRSVDWPALTEANLVLTMTRAQARELVARDSALWPRTFTLKQFNQYIVTNPIPRLSDLESWLTSVHEARTLSELIGNNTPDEIADPMGRSVRTWRRVIAEIDREVTLAMTALATVLPRHPRAA